MSREAQVQRRDPGGGEARAKDASAKPQSACSDAGDDHDGGDFEFARERRKIQRMKGHQAPRIP
jgi:hypothetical protein